MNINEKYSKTCQNIVLYFIIFGVTIRQSRFLLTMLVGIYNNIQKTNTKLLVLLKLCNQESIKTTTNLLRLTDSCDRCIPVFPGIYKNKYKSACFTQAVNPKIYKNQYKFVPQNRFLWTIHFWNPRNIAKQIQICTFYKTNIHFHTKALKFT